MTEQRANGDALASTPFPDVPGPCLAYFTTDATERHLVDQDQWDPGELAAREREVCRALLRHALARLDVYDQARAMGLKTRGDLASEKAGRET